jgi:hypothetical protein
MKFDWTDWLLLPLLPFLYLYWTINPPHDTQNPPEHYNRLQ